MTATPYPLPSSIRQSAVLLGDGSTTYGPFGDGWGIFDIDDVLVETRAVATTVFTEAAVTIAKVNPAAAYDFFYVTFAAPLTSGFEYRVTGKRLQERELAVTRGGAIDGLALEKELSKLSVVLQEMRRDINGTAVMVAGDSASSALADRLLAQAAAASAAASAAIFAGALAILVGNAGGTASAPTLAHASFTGLVAYPNDMLVVFRITAANPGAMTLAAGPLASKPFVDRAGDAFVGGEWQIGDIAIALYNVTNNTFRALDRIVDMVLSDKLNVFTVLQSFNGNINVASKATFTKQVVYPPVTLVDAVTIAWDFATGTHFAATLGGNRTMGLPANETVGQEGYLDLIQDATGGRGITWNAAYKQSDGQVPEQPDPTPDRMTRYVFSVRGADDVIISKLNPSRWFELEKTADQTSITNVAADVSELTFPMLANTNYKFVADLHVQQPASGGAIGIVVGVNGPAAPVLVNVSASIRDSANGNEQAEVYVAYGVGAANFSNAAVRNGTIHFEGLIQNGVNAGTFALRFRQNTLNAGVAIRIYKGSSLSWRIAK